MGVEETVVDWDEGEDGGDTARLGAVSCSSEVGVDTPPPVTAAAGELEEENPAKPVVTQPVEKKVKKMAMKIVRVGRENDFFILALLEESFITRKAGFTDFSMTILKWKSKNLRRERKKLL